MEVTFIGVNNVEGSAMQELLSKNSSQRIVRAVPNDNVSFLGCGIALTAIKTIENENDLLDSSNSGKE